MRKAVFLLLLLLVPLSAYPDRYRARETYIENYKDIAIQQMHKYGIPASITLAQGCLESGDGKSRLAVKGNNHFGIKCHDWNGPRIYRDDDKRNECFRKYSSVEASYNDHSRFLRYRDRYSFLFDLDPGDYRGWAYGLKKAGYATNPQYAKLLIGIIEEYRLYEYDRPQKSRRNSKKFVPPTPAELKAFTEYKPAATSSLYKYSTTRKLYRQNGVVFLIANQSDSYESLAREFNLFKNEILRYNDLKEPVPLHKGMVVYLRPKKKKAARHLNLHIAEAGETYYQISQRYAVKLKKILEYNGLNPQDTAPREGESVILR